MFINTPRIYNGNSGIINEESNFSIISPKSLNPCLRPSDLVAEIPIPRINEIISAVVTSKIGVILNSI